MSIAWVQKPATVRNASLILRIAGEERVVRFTGLVPKPEAAFWRFATKIPLPHHVGVGVKVAEGLADLPHLTVGSGSRGDEAASWWRSALSAPGKSGVGDHGDDARAILAAAADEAQALGETSLEFDKTKDAVTRVRVAVALRRRLRTPSDRAKHDWSEEDWRNESALAHALRSLSQACSGTEEALNLANEALGMVRVMAANGAGDPLDMAVSSYFVSRSQGS
jgi:hypothetical protein